MLCAQILSLDLNGKILLYLFRIVWLRMKNVTSDWYGMIICVDWFDFVDSDQVVHMSTNFVYTDHAAHGICILGSFVNYGNSLYHWCWLQWCASIWRPVTSVAFMLFMWRQLHSCYCDVSTFYISFTGVHLFDVQWRQLHSCYSCDVSCIHVIATSALFILVSRIRGL